MAELDKLVQATFLDMFGDPVTNPKGWEVWRSSLKSDLFHGILKPGDFEPQIMLRIQDIRGGKVCDSMSTLEAINELSLQLSERVYQ